MRGGRWRWWRDQRSQRKRSLHAWMGWDKHSDILSHAMCARNECDSRDRTWTKKTIATTRTFTCSCCASCWYFTGSWFSRCHWCRTPQRPARRFCSSTAFHHAYATPSAKFFSSECCRFCPVIVHSICIPNSCICHIAKTGLFTPRRLQ